ncbi:hypothetical protein HRR80_9607 [Exophiala dermatitidis]|uniref:Uncharacterized protein n=1 Tax=Exophiala dermatitidis TaxID=5970 RepID=A0AAN6F261_EXODE|nr:hypothetical protein HRR80_9607 [Exophiala dermatitidis]
MPIHVYHSPLVRHQRKRYSLHLALRRVCCNLSVLVKGRAHFSPGVIIPDWMSVVFQGAPCDVRRQCRNRHTHDVWSSGGCSWHCRQVNSQSGYPSSQAGCRDANKTASPKGTLWHSVRLP